MQEKKENISVSFDINYFMTLADDINKEEKQYQQEMSIEAEKLRNE
jgi:hypothetical protein